MPTVPTIQLPPITFVDKETGKLTVEGLTWFTNQLSQISQTASVAAAQSAQAAYRALQQAQQQAVK
jgi:hypothetical protein